MTDVDKYINAIHNSTLKGLARKLRRNAKRALPKAVESMKMRVPNYSIDGKNIASIADYSNQLVFLSGSKANLKMLEGTGKGMRTSR